MRPIINEFNTFTYNPAKIVSDYLRPLAQNKYVIKDTLLFAEIIKNDILDPGEEYLPAYQLVKPSIISSKQFTRTKQLNQCVKVN